ncbi:MAG TPA: ATP-binding protein [Streptosporangiaceae bacterium]|nr:ATP-binding protein [Streptosporangiaceae bacterium]
MSDNQQPSKMARVVQVSHAFTPAAPIDQVSLFAGRLDQVFSCMDAISQRGLHVALYGERGVGKTSLANVLPKIITGAEVPELGAIRVDCNTNDNYGSIWRKIFRELGRSSVDPEELPGHQVTDPEDVRFRLQRLGRDTLIVIDEFDRVEDDDALSLLADTVKTLSDHTVGATLMFVGVAASVENLLGEHESIVRNVRQVPMQRMSSQELEAALDKGFEQVVDLEISDAAKARIIFAAEGLPHFAHLLGLNSGHVAVTDDRNVVETQDVELAEAKAVRTHSMLSEYRKATQSAQPQHLFEEVLLACAYARRDGLGYFRARDLRSPLSDIVGRPMTIQQFQRHLNELSGPVRQALSKEGELHNYVYRFRNPLFQPFAKMAARAKGLISDDLAGRLQDRQLADSEPTLFDA